MLELSAAAAARQLRCTAGLLVEAKPAVLAGDASVLCGRTALTSAAPFLVSPPQASLRTVLSAGRTRTVEPSQSLAEVLDPFPEVALATVPEVAPAAEAADAAATPTGSAAGKSVTLVEPVAAAGRSGGAASHMDIVSLALQAGLACACVP